MAGPSGAGTGLPKPEPTGAGKGKAPGPTGAGKGKAPGPSGAGTGIPKPEPTGAGKGKAPGPTGAGKGKAPGPTGAGGGPMAAGKAVGKGPKGPTPGTGPAAPSQAMADPTGPPPKLPKVHGVVFGVAGDKSSFQLRHNGSTELKLTKGATSFKTKKAGAVNAVDGDEVDVYVERIGAVLVVVELRHVRGGAPAPNAGGSPKTSR